MTNTFYEGRAAGQPKAQRGHSKEGRTDAPLLTLGLVLDASGFVRRSSVFAGNVAEATTLGTMLESLGASRKGVVIMDRGIATKANLAWLRDNAYRYLVVSRDSTRVFDADKAATTVLTASRETVDVYIEEVVGEEQDAGSYREVLLRCHSEARAKKEKGILDRFQKRFEDALAALHEGLSALGLHRHHRPQHRKALALRQRRVAPAPILGLALDALAVGEVLPRIARPVQPVGDEVHPHALGAHPRVVHHLKLHPAPSTEVRLVQRRAISETITGHGT